MGTRVESHPYADEAVGRRIEELEQRLTTAQELIVVLLDIAEAAKEFVEHDIPQVGCACRRCELYRRVGGVYDMKYGGTRK